MLLLHWVRQAELGLARKSSVLHARHGGNVVACVTDAVKRIKEVVPNTLHFAGFKFDVYF